MAKKTLTIRMESELYNQIQKTSAARYVNMSAWCIMGLTSLLPVVTPPKPEKPPKPPKPETQAEKKARLKLEAAEQEVQRVNALLDKFRADIPGTMEAFHLAFGRDTWAQPGKIWQMLGYKRGGEDEKLRRPVYQVMCEMRDAGTLESDCNTPGMERHKGNDLAEMFRLPLTKGEKS